MTCRNKGLLASCFAVLLLVVAGCAPLSTGGGARGAGPGSRDNAPATNSIDTIYVGDQIRIVYSDAPLAIPATEVQVPETGIVTIHLGEQLKVAGKKTHEIADEVKDLYTVKKQIYRRLAVTVQVLGRSVSVGGDVRSPGSFGFEGGMTVIKAINRAGGFTDFGSRTRVTVTRVGGEQITVNCEDALKNPELDVALFPGDRIYVPRKFL